MREAMAQPMQPGWRIPHANRTVSRQKYDTTVRCRAGNSTKIAALPA